MTTPATTSDTALPEAPAAAPPSLWRTLPFSQFKRDEHFYVKYDALHLVGAVALIASLVMSGYRAPFATWQPWMIVFLPIATYLLILCHVFIHNASHGNFPKAINRVVGEILGVCVLTKFASWEIVHRRHHRYSDDPVRDPHPAERGYWSFAKNTLINVEKQLQQQYFDCHGDAPERRRYERFRSVFSFVSRSAVALAWFTLLGPILFFVGFLPGSVLAGLFVVHFNWTGHNAHLPDTEIGPTNLDTGWFWLGNRLFFGIYFHGNHHKNARVFNPRHMPTRPAREEGAEA